MDTPIQPLAKNPYLIAKLAIVDADGEPIPKPFTLKEGGYTFRCIATYADGSSSFYEPYWTCPIYLKSGGSDSWAVLGRGRRERVTINASKNHERYMELACWAFRPEQDRTIEIVHDGTSFDYSLIEAIE
jgi:hypothetical protein